MHASQLSNERRRAIGQQFRSEFSDPVRALALSVHTQGLACANGDDELEIDMIGTGVGYAISMLISIIGTRHPDLIANPRSCMENWIDAIGSGIKCAVSPCDCDECRREKLP